MPKEHHEDSVSKAMASRKPSDPPRLRTNTAWTIETKVFNGFSSSNPDSIRRIVAAWFARQLVVEFVPRGGE